jgi:hypothetical protein
MSRGPALQPPITVPTAVDNLAALTPAPLSITDRDGCDKTGGPGARTDQGEREDELRPTRNLKLKNLPPKLKLLKLLLRPLDSGEVAKRLADGKAVIVRGSTVAAFSLAP